MKFPIFHTLKFCAAECFVFLFLPIFMIISAGSGILESSGFWSIPLLMLLISALAGILFKSLIYPRAERCCGSGLVLANLLGILLTIVVGVAGGAAAFAIPTAGASYSFSASAFSAAAGVFCAVSFLSGSLIWERGYGEILTTTYFLILAVLDAVCLLICTLAKWQIGTTLLAICYLIAAGFSALARNQSNIDFLMDRRRHNRSHLPAKMRWYSLSLVSGCFTIILLGFLFRKQIARLLNWCVEMLRQGIIFLLKLGPAGEESAPPPASEIPPAAPPELGLPKSEGSSAFWTVFGYLVLAGILFLVFFYRREIFAALQNLFRKVKKFLRALLFRKGTVTPTLETDGCYQDDVQDLPRESSPESAKKQRPYDCRMWKKEYRAFRAMPDSEKKAREGYRLSLLYLLLNRVPISPSDTPEEILQKAKGRLPDHLFREVTASYRDIRYGEETPSDTSPFSTLLEICAQQLR